MMGKERGRKGKKVKRRGAAKTRIYIYIYILIQRRSKEGELARDRMLHEKKY